MPESWGAVLNSEQEERSDSPYMLFVTHFIGRFQVVCSENRTESRFYLSFSWVLAGLGAHL